MKDASLVVGAVPVSTILSRAFVAGFVASVAMLAAFGMAFAACLALGNLQVLVLADWFRGLTSNPLISLARPNLFVATGVFLAGGLIWAVLYGLVFERRLRGPNWERGVIFALMPWLFSLLVFLPLVGGGLLGFDLGAGPLPIVGNLILHVVYGVVLGTVYGVGESLPDGPPDGDDVWASPRSQVGAARGVLIGLGLGIAVGLVAATIPDLTGSRALGLNQYSVVPIMALVGAAFGGLFGSLT
jgi:hypothetical protein